MNEKLLNSISRKVDRSDVCYVRKGDSGIGVLGILFFRILSLLVLNFSYSI